MPKRKNQLFMTFILVVLVAGVVIYLNKAQPTLNTETISAPVPGSSTTTTTNTSSTAFETKTNTILFLSSTASSTDIYKISAQGGDKRKVFTDADENLKIKSANSMTDDGKAALAVMGPKDQQFGGSLYLLSTDGSGTKEKLLDDFASPQPPAISPDGNLITYVMFSNAESDFGFSLNVMNRDGSNKRQIYKNKTGIGLPTWDSSANKIVFVSLGTDKADLMTIDKSGGEGKLIKSYPDSIIYSLAFHDDNLLLVAGPKDKKENPSAVILNTKDLKEQKISTVQAVSSLIMSSDTKVIVYAATASGNTDDYDIYVSINKGEPHVLVVGDYPIGFIND